MLLNFNRLKRKLLIWGGAVETVIGDVSESLIANKLLEVAIQSYGGCDILVNNAGITHSVSIIDLLESDWDRLLRVNLKSTYLCTRAVLNYMLKNRKGKIVNISSIAGRGGGAFGSSHYATSKAGIIGFTRAVAKEVAPYGVTINAIAPASIDTDILKGKPSKDGLSPEEVHRNRIDRTPLKRLGSAKEVASVIAFFASDESSFITGAVLDVNGGVFMGG